MPRAKFDVAVFGVALGDPLGHHISSCPARCSANVHDRPKPYTVAGLGRQPKSANISQCSALSARLATKWLHDIEARQVLY
jgi:hypothetical protein